MSEPYYNGRLPEASENPLDTQLQTAAADNYASDEKLSTSSEAAAPLIGDPAMTKNDMGRA